MCEPTTLAIIASAGSGALSAYSAYQQTKTNAAVATNNVQIAEYQAQDAQRRGELEAQAIQRKALQVKGAQRVGLAAHGLDLGYGTASDLQTETDFFSQQDVATTRSNAAKEAWSRRAQGANFQAEATSASPWMTAGGTLLGGTARVADQWYQYTRTK